MSFVFKPCWSISARICSGVGKRFYPYLWGDPLRVSASAVRYGQVLGYTGSLDL